MRCQSFSDPMREAKNSPTHSNFSAPDNLQGAPLPHTPLQSWPCQMPLCRASHIWELI